MKLIVKVFKIKGKCPVYKMGDKIVLDKGYKVNLKETDNICMHSLSSLFPYYNALAKGVSPIELGLSRNEEEAYIQCLDPEKYTGGGTVTFKIYRKDS
jgi:uncharacterized repeat protein (TIGR04076 family)